jgi:hypothetical protein
MILGDKPLISEVILSQRDVGRGTTVKRNNDDRWSSDGVVLWLWRRQNGDVIQWWRE